MSQLQFHPLIATGRRILGRAALGLAATALAAAGAQASSVQMVPESGGPYVVSVTSYRDLPFRIVVRQKYDFSCGSAALATLLKYQYGRAVDEAQIFKAMFATGDQKSIDRLGFSMADMKRYLAAQGLGSDGYRIPLQRFAQIGTPGIAVVNVRQYKHFVVIKSIAQGRVLVGDPAIGLRSYSLGQFQAMWDGIVFVIHDRAHSNDHHGFDDPRQWALVAPAPFEPVVDQPPAINDLALAEIRTVFQVLPPSIVSDAIVK